MKNPGEETLDFKNGGDQAMLGNNVSYFKSNDLTLNKRNITSFRKKQAQTSSGWYFKKQKTSFLGTIVSFFYSDFLEMFLILPINF